MRYLRLCFVSGIFIGIIPIAEAQLRNSAIQATATVTGTVVGSDGVPLNAILRFTSSGPTAVSSTLVSSSGDGAFTATNLTPGSYQVCVTVQGGGYLDPCLWNDSGITLSLTAKQNLTAQTFQVQQAARVQIRLSDPQKILGTAQGPSALLMGVFAPGGRFYPVMEKSSDATGTTYEISVPADQTVPFSIQPIGYALTSSTGATIGQSGGAISISASSLSLTTPTVLTYTVSGLASTASAQKPSQAQ